MRIAWILLFVFALVCNAAGDAITVEDLELLLALKVPAATITDLVRQRGLAFTLNSETSQRILAAGGNQVLIGALVESAAASKTSEPAQPQRVERTAQNPKDGQEYVRIPAGTFTMGCSSGDQECGSDERPAHPVTITKEFWLGATEVPVEAYQKFVRETAGLMPEGSRQAGQPMVNVTWMSADTYCSWIGGRLPTEAEWEYAARAGSVGVRYGPLNEIAWYASNTGRQIKQVGEKTPNVFGLFDMLGNVLEWVNDWYSPAYYRSSPANDPPGPGKATERSVRGGSFSNKADVLRLSARDKNSPGASYPNLGFRCVWKR